METAQEYFSEITNESTNESKGKAVASSRQTSKKTEYDRCALQVYSFSSLIESGIEV